MTADNMTWNPSQAWRRFRLEAEAARNYPVSFSMDDFIGTAHRRDALLEALLPTLLYIKAVAIFDDSMKLWLEQNGHKSPSSDLYGRLKYLADKRLLDDVETLHTVREERNRLAHEPGASCDWQRFGDDVSTVEKALVSLTLVRPTPKLEYFAVCSAMEGSNEPGVHHTRRFSYGVKENGKIALEISWTQRIFGDESS
jgi:hypothetical protein